MIFEFQVRSRNVGGATSVYGPVWGRLELTVTNSYGAMIQTLKIEPCVPIELQAPNADERRMFGRIPNVAVKLKKKTVTIRFLSRFAVAADIESTAIRLELCNNALSEISDILELLRGRFAPADDFDLDQFLSDCSRALSIPFNSVEEIHELDDQEISVSGPVGWNASELDWDDKRYHRDARKVLNNPRFWSRGDEFSPHGSDTGSDLLDNYLQGSLGNMDINSYAEDVIREWGVHASSWDVTESTQCAQLYRMNRQYYTIRNQITLGVAFAELKTKSTCSATVAEQGLRAITRELFDFVDVLPAFVDERQSMLTFMETVLKQFAK